MPVYDCRCPGSPPRLTRCDLCPHAAYRGGEDAAWDALAAVRTAPPGLGQTVVVAEHQVGTSRPCPGVRDRGATTFPVNVVIRDKRTGERIPGVFWLDTAGSLKRFIVDGEGRPVADAEGRRLEVRESRPWVAVTPDGRETVAQSEGV